MNYYTDEWKWLFNHAIDWELILPYYYPEYPTPEGLNSAEEVLQFYQEILSTTGQWTSTAVLERALVLDHEGAGEVRDGRTWAHPMLEKSIQDATELGVFGLSLPTEYGGSHAPQVLSFVIWSQIARSCIGQATQLAFFTSIAEMIHRFGTSEQRQKFIPQILEGKISGSMNLTEPGCGSDLTQLKTRAKLQEDGTYLLNGSKCFITNGGGGLAFVLAKIEGAPDSLEGISLFFVEQEIEVNGEKKLNFQVTKNEEKMGMHASFTTEIVYENTIAELVGEPGEGFKFMLHLMNESRIGTAMQGVAGMEAALTYAQQYASERKAFGKPIGELPLLKRNIQDMQTELDGLRALLMDTISHYEVYQFLDAKVRHTGDLNKKEKADLREAKTWVRKRTPLVKYYATEFFAHKSISALQVLGGYGFMKEYPMERYHRDSFGPLLYEGTSQIQALMALKDLVKYAIKDPKRFFSNIVAKHPTKEFLSRSDECTRLYKSMHYQFKKKLIRLLFSKLRPQTRALFDLKAWQNEEGISALMVHAETLCQALSYLETLRVLWRHSGKDPSRKTLFMRYARLVKPRLAAIYTDWEENLEI